MSFGNVCPLGGLGLIPQLEPTMINLKVLSAAGVLALVATTMMPAPSFAQTPFNHPSGNLAARAGGTAAPSGAPRFNGGGAPHFNGGTHFSGGGGGGGGNFHHHGGGGFIPGAVAGAVIGGAIASHGPRYYGGGAYFDGNAYYGGDPDYVDDYSGGPVADGPVVVQVAPGGGDDVAYCMQTYRSYDRRSGTYLGLDGYRHPCP
jgi:hypothetical protein